MSSLFGGGGGGQIQAPLPPKPIQLNLNRLERQTTHADQAAYAQADQYMQQFYPALTQARNNMIQQSYGALTGGLDPTLENAFVNQANMNSAAALGGGDQSFGLGKGSLARNAAAANVAQSQQSYEDYNRAQFNQLNSLYAPRTFGLTPEDAANIFTFNNTQMNNYLQQKYAGQTQTYFANQGIQAQQGAAGSGIIAGLASAVIQGLISY